MPRSMTIVGLLLGALLLWQAPGAVAAEAGLPRVDGFPSQPIRLVVYTSPGGLIDVTARRFAQLAQEHSGHPFAVINRPGGGGIVAFEEVLREPADGHRFLAVTRSNVSKMVAIGREDLIDRIHWHASIMDNAHVLITNAEEGPPDWEALHASGRSSGRQQRWLGVDIGGVKHVSGVKIAEAVGIDMRWIPYGSGGEAVAALLGNLGTAYLGNPRDAMTSDRLRIVAVAADERLREFPDVPTFAELGYPGLEDELIWRGFAFRRGIPDDVQAWYDALIRKVVEDPRWIEAWRHEAVNLRYRNAESFGRIIERDRDEFRSYLARLNLLPDTEQPAGGLAALARPPGLWLLLGLIFATIISASALLPRSRWRDGAGELTLLIATTLITLLVLVLTVRLPAANPVDPIGAGGVPRLWIALLLPLALFQIGLCLRQMEPVAGGLQTGRVLVSLALFGSYLLLLPVLGYALASLIYMPGLIFYLGYRRLPVVAAITVGWLTFSEVVFQRLLFVDLPRGWWFG
ncbi:MAG: hypothetical protein JJT88_04410 [Gammaproteobacteria bacterium]|nr:hypothetical protein [Gammaproteobacteria bacterium]